MSLSGPHVAGVSCPPCRSTAIRILMGSDIGLLHGPNESFRKYIETHLWPRLLSIAAVYLGSLPSFDIDVRVGHTTLQGTTSLIAYVTEADERHDAFTAYFYRTQGTCGYTPWPVRFCHRSEDDLKTIINKYVKLRRCNRTLSSGAPITADCNPFDILMPACLRELRTGCEDHVETTKYRRTSQFRRKVPGPGDAIGFALHFSTFLFVDRSPRFSNEHEPELSLRVLILINIPTYGFESHTA
ncbi:hypothetical protein AB1N83_007659 [Pleurotus pulmonarius]